MYNPLLDKKPYGASVANQATTMRFPVPCDMHIRRVFVVLRQVFPEGKDASLRYELPFEKSENGQDIFVGAFALKEWGVWKYRFEGELEDGDLLFSVVLSTGARCAGIGCPNGS